VITTRDSGGSLELLEDHTNGLVSEPDPRALASAMDELWSNKKLTIGLGERAYETLSVHNISWDATIATLVG
jgi:glycosyltransferase involved in cell wall biosynthesis